MVYVMVYRMYNLVRHSASGFESPREDKEAAVTMLPSVRVRGSRSNDALFRSQWTGSPTGVPVQHSSPIKNRSPNSPIKNNSPNSPIKIDVVRPRGS